MSAPNRPSKRTSPLWKVFELLDSGSAKCTICGSILAFTSSTANLKRHLLFKHRGVFYAILPQSNPQNYEASGKALKDLIRLVKMHPCLWDSRTESYEDAMKQQESWAAIASELYPNENPRQVIAKLSRQFSRLRADFFANRGHSMFKELSFLDPLLGYEEEKIIAEEFEENEDFLCNVKEEDRSSYISQDNIEQPNQYSNQSIGEGNSVMVTKQDPLSFQLQINCADEESLFLLSLAEEIRKVPVEFEMSFKSEFLKEFNKLVDKYTNDAK